MKKLNKRQKFLLIIITILFITMGISNIYYVYYERPEVFNSDEITLTVIILFSCFVLISSIYIYLLNNIANYEKAYYEEHMNQKQIELILQRKRVLEENHKIYLENHKKQEKILDEIYQKIIQDQDIHFDDYDVMEQYYMKYCDSVYVDTLLYSKSLYALEKDILFDIDVIYEGKFIDNIDMNTILFNLIDNAFEASILTNEKRVKLQLREIKGIVYISISNTKKDEIVNIDSTSKEDKNNHGLGIKIVEDVIRGYQGKIEYQDKGKVMEVQVTLFKRG